MFIKTVISTVSKRKNNNFKLFFWCVTSATARWLASCAWIIWITTATFAHKKSPYSKKTAHKKLSRKENEITWKHPLKEDIKTY